MIRYLRAAALVLLASCANAFITVNEGLPTTRDAVYIGTTTPQLLLNGGTYYAGTVPNVSLAVASNTVLGNCVFYATGTAFCNGVQLSTTNPAGVYVPYSGATSNVNLGAKTLTTSGNIQGGQIGAGTAPSSNFYFDGLSGSGSGYVRIGAGVNQATGYYWGGTRGYSLQERYDLTGTPFTLHDELNNVDRFYLDTSGAWYLPLSVTVGTFTSLGAASMNSNQIHNVLDPTSNQDAATKFYVDSSTLAIPTKNPARVITTAALPANTYNNGSSGVGATLTGLSIGVLTVDGVALSVADRVIVNNEASPQNNGIYTVTANSSLVVYVLTRATDHDTVAEMGAGVTLYVDSGTINQDTYWAQVASVTTVGNSNSPVNFVQTNGLASVTVTAALTKNGNQLGINSSSVAVLSGSLVLNNQIDHSSVPFLSSSLINNYQIDPSSVNKVIGISSGPAGSSQFLENATIRDGVITGGDFAAASGGGSTPQFVFLSSQDSTNSSRLSFDSSWFIFNATTQYKFNFYGVMPSSTSNLFANINCLTNGGTAGNYNYIHGGGVSGNTSQGYNGDSSSSGNGKSFALNNEAANTDNISIGGWLQGSVIYEALSDTMTIREIWGYTENDSSGKGTTSNVFYGGKYSGPGKGWTSICFDLSSGFFNANIDRTRAWSWFHVDVWKGQKLGQ